MKFNVNNYVRVRLTSYGKEILRRNARKFSPAFRKFALPKEDSEGWSEWQMLYLMEEFGDYIRLGGDLPFETEIDIVEKVG